MSRNCITTLLEERERVIKIVISEIDSYSYTTKLEFLELVHQSDGQICEYLQSRGIPKFTNVVYLKMYPLRRIDRKILMEPANIELENLSEYLLLYKRRNNFFPKAIAKLKQACDRLD